MKEYKINIEALNSVLPAVSKESHRFCLNGVFVEDKEGWRHYTATEGHILFTVKTEIDGDSLEKPLILIIKKPLKYKGNVIGMMQVVDNETVVIKTNQEKVAVDIIDCTYPDYERVIPPENTKKASEFALFDPDFLNKVYDFLGVRNQIPLMDDCISPALYIKDNKRAVLMPMKESR